VTERHERFVNDSARSLVAAVPDGDAGAFHRRLDGYAPTPLVEVARLAQQLGVGRVLVKVEAERFALPSFKFLGASWAAYRALARMLMDVRAREAEPWTSTAELAARFEPLRPLTLVAPTDGNHGRAVARVARLLELGARVYVPENTVAARIDGIESEGASVVVVDGTYDDTVERAAAEDGSDGVLVVSDTAWPGYETIPADVVAGYSTIFAELDEQLGAVAATPALVVVPVGVGGLAAAAVRHYRSVGVQAGTAVLSVEPTRAACVLESLRAGRIVTLEGGQDSIMAGLNCGTPSPVAWPDLVAGLDAAVAVDDADAERAMRELADVGIVAGESGAASLAGATAVAGDATLRAALGAGADACVVLLSTEGATDPVSYARIVGPPLT
jgi:diaminopropionate ammonia-lyase